VLTLTDVMDFFADEFAGLCGRPLAFPFLLHGSSNRIPLRHMYLPSPLTSCKVNSCRTVRIYPFEIRGFFPRRHHFIGGQSVSCVQFVIVEAMGLSLGKQPI